MSEIICDICFHHCHLKEGKTGLCRARKNIDGINVCANAGRLTSLALDPIEKKPLARYYPGSYILSAGSYGCNLSCGFCQNYSISMTDESSVRWQYFSAEELAEIILRAENSLGIAFTYNEPLISYEYIIDVSKRIRPYGKKTVLVSNGTCERHVLEKIMPYVDAMNIDLKGNDVFYRELGGDYQAVKNTIAYVYDKCHLEVTTLVVPGKNDDTGWMEQEAEWLASLDENIVLHVSRYFPRFHYTIPATEKETVLNMQKAAQKYLKYVYTGNLW